jgi:hypothetical protein
VNVIAGYELGSGWILGAKFSYASGSPYTLSADDNQNIIRTEMVDFGLIPIIGLTAQF